MTERQTLGRSGEERAAEFLHRRGYRVIERNWRAKRWGEIDLVAIDGDTLVFVEVKTRQDNDLISPSETVSFYKQRALKHSARLYKKDHPELPDALRIDIVSVSGSKIELFQNLDF